MFIGPYTSVALAKTAGLDYLQYKAANGATPFSSLTKPGGLAWGIYGAGTSYRFFHTPTTAGLAAFIAIYLP